MSKPIIDNCRDLVHRLYAKDKDGGITIVQFWKMLNNKPDLNEMPLFKGRTSGADSATTRKGVSRPPAAP